MGPTASPVATVGVQELIDRIRGEGVSAGRDEAQRIVREAQEQAAAIRAKAQEEARQTLEKARAQIETEQAAGIEALKNAARDTLLELKANVRSAFEIHVRRLVSTRMQDTGFVRSLVLVLAGHAAEEYITDQDAKIFVAVEGNEAQAASFTPAQREKLLNAVMGVGAEMLRAGVELFPDDKITGGARVRLKGKDLEIDLTDQAISRVLVKYLLPRYREIVEEGLV